MSFLKRCSCFGNNDDVLLSELPNRYGQAHKPNNNRNKRKIDKSAIGKPSNFQHTGHIGISELQSGVVDRVDPEKIKKQMAEIAAVLNFDDLITPELESIQRDNPTKEAPTHKAEVSRKETDTNATVN
ncbi:hypothetical protein K493DRAFT_317535 [Basidiobolus meristosporus CBS 931.73]|uniref:CRIB domain-containing protein n=1 Tax=Basidiobolus meristosporus CBS 931.73 TaxID=1314790 RepID=A0A1Y1XZ99_9FUNG|nr:hypothetical protein K493DRAFT_321588 [Basidiobolus meristosporus CBS 931.73]ORX91080.1 hypothetical protein K493DRAFT_317535 [Basidiobolus meristosporus CBS 931.73]|eukprot:ORX76258.1 hypothetical protein K493DRAFT_321588 [Basidiobolus meristosporus CBS 931.73]